MRNRIIFLLAFFALAYSVQAAIVIPFSSPENSYQAISEFIRDSEKSVYISVYTFTDYQLAQEIAENSRTGKKIKILIEGSPAADSIDKGLMCYLENNLVEVYIYRGDLKFLHAKYIIRDERSVLVTSENFGPDSFHKNRGWGLEVEDKNLAMDLVSIFEEDLAKSEAINCEDIKGELTFSKNPVGKYDFTQYKSDGLKLIKAPGAVQGVLDFLDGANESIYIEQFYIYPRWGSKGNLFLEKVIEKAEKGVNVKIILDSNYYNLDKKGETSNFYTAEYIKQVMSEKQIPIDVKLADLEKLGFSKIHAKGVIIDNKSVLVSSINWNENSPRNNREIGVIAEGPVADYFVGKFFTDWGTGVHEGRNGSPHTGKAAVKDYSLSIMQILLFTVFTAAIMVAIKKRFRS